MEIFRRAPNPWGQEVLLGIGYGLFWVAVAAGAAFIVVHSILVVWLNSREGASEEGGGVSGEASGVPAKVMRHNLASRLFHWAMAISMFALLITAFVPVIGFKFDWVTIHWIAGLALIAAIVYHIVHAIFFQSLRAIWVWASDVRYGINELKHMLGLSSEVPGKTGKYPVANKLYHHGAAAAALVAMVTGLFMMKRIDTPIFQQNQYMLGDMTWGIIYVLHGLAGVVLVLMVIDHVYMAVRPDKWWQTRSMFRGWISREEYLTHHDPAEWPVEGAATPQELEPAGVGAGPGDRLEQSV